MYNLIGQKFGRLTVIGYVQDYVTKTGSVVPRWKCLCDCQLDLPEEERKYSYIATSDLLSGKTKSCGCLNDESRIKTDKQNKLKLRKYKNLPYDKNQRIIYSRWMD